MKIIIPLVVVTALLTQCGDPSDKSGAINDASQENIIKVTPEQYQACGITMAKIEKQSIASRLTVSGILDLPPQNMATVSAAFGGYIKSTTMIQGMHVKKGEVLAVLENQEYIQLQQDYLDNRSKLLFLEEEYTRQQDLAKDNVNAKKTLQQSRSQYESMKAVLAGLEAKLNMIGITSSSLSLGKITSTIALRSPIDGFINAVNVNTGQFVSPTDVLFTIANLDRIHLALKVYEKDIDLLTPGQHVLFRLLNDTTTYTGSIHLIGKEIGADRTVAVHCHIDGKHAAMLPGMFVTAEIETTAAVGNAVPATSVVNYEGKTFIFTSVAKDQFKAIEVRTGNSTGDYTQVEISPASDIPEMVVRKGAFELMGLLKNKQE
jgi:membrane fusion protein, heavy metal efflux system